jgi:hypothetical protein
MHAELTQPTPSQHAAPPALILVYEQGVRPVQSALGSLFGGGGDEDAGDDPLVYVKPKDPLMAKPVAAAAPAAKVRLSGGQAQLLGGRQALCRKSAAGHLLSLPLTSSCRFAGSPCPL